MAQIFPEKELHGYSPNSYIHGRDSSDRSAYSAAGKYIGGPNVGIYRSFTDT
jgi:hypothetical protein